jgi:glucose/arabinose dehydrogenase
MSALFADSSTVREEIDSFAQKSESDDLFREPQSKIIFIDPSVEDYQSLSPTTQGSEVIVLDANSNGIQQITEVLKERKNISSVHIVSHGTSANLYLGMAQLSLDNLNSYKSAIGSWTQALSPYADILLYGCNVAAGDKGNTFIERLSNLTGADIAASIDLTGSDRLGGDWELESSTGEIESALAFSPQSMQAYNGVLNIRVEAESMTLRTYRIESISSASGGQVMSLAGGRDRETGEGSFQFTGSSGNYNLVIGYYDENDGVGQLRVRQNDTTLDSWSLGQNLGSSLPDATTFTTRTIATNLSVDRGDTFTIRGRENGSERIRVDYLELVPVVADPSVLALSASDYSINEAAGTVTVTVLRTGGTDGTVSVDYNTVDDTATVAGGDYTAVSGTLTFAPGETSKDVTISILNDTSVEGDENFNFVIDNVGGNGSLGAPRTASINVTDDDTPADPVLITESDGTTQVTEGGASDSYSVVLSRQPTANVAIAINPNSQLTTNVSTLTFTPENWNVAQTVTVSAVDDSAQEGNHTGTIAHNVTSDDSSFNGFSLRNVDVSIADDDSGTFIVETFASGLTSPTAFDWSPDGQRMYVAQKDGVVRVVENGTLQSTPFIDISAEVNNVRDRGLLGIAVHPDFANNPYIYLAYTYDPPEAAQGTGLAARDGAGNRPSRVIRVTADASTNFTTAVPGSEVVILGTNSTWANTSRPDGNSTNDLSIPPSGITPEGENIQDYLATDSESHTIGALRFGTDGSLYVSNGDGTSYNAVDPRTVRVQDLDNLSGKILRIDPITGDGLSSNPFFNGDPDSNRSKVYSYGLRNPFRFTVNRDTNEPFIGDVGWTEWEEVNTGRGVNFGWPYFEGGNRESLRRGGYSELPEAQAFYASGQPVTPAIYARAHADGAVAIIMGDFYTGTSFPEIYQDALFFSDFGDNTVRYLSFDDAGNVDVNTFSTGISGIVQMSTGADSNLYFANLLTGQIGRWRYDPTTIAEGSNEFIDNRNRNVIWSPDTSFLFS